MNADRITVPEAAELLGVGVHELMAWMRCKTPPPFGAYIIKDGKKQGRYIIYRSRVLAYVQAADLTMGCESCATASM